LLELKGISADQGTISNALTKNLKQASRLWEACRVGDAAAISKLLAYGVSVYAGEPGVGNTPLHIVAASGHVDACRAVLRSRAWVSVRCLNNDGMTPYEVAVQHGYGDRLGSLLGLSGGSESTAAAADRSALLPPASAPPRAPAAATIATATAVSSKRSRGRAAKGKGKSPRSSDVPQSLAPPPNQVDWSTFSAMVDRVAELEKQVARLQATVGEGGSTS
jgi:ankyrin repeat protein